MTLVRSRCVRSRALAERTVPWIVAVYALFMSFFEPFRSEGRRPIFGLP